MVVRSVDRGSQGYGKKEKIVFQQQAHYQSAPFLIWLLFFWVTFDKIIL
jgi:hypothetical protein